MKDAAKKWHERHYAHGYGYEIDETETGYKLTLMDCELESLIPEMVEVGGGSFPLTLEGYCDAVNTGADWLNGKTKDHPLRGQIPVFANDGNQTLDEALAENTALIDAAPEMLRVLEMFVAWHDDLHIPVSQGRVIRDEAIAIIKKAREEG